MKSAFIIGPYRTERKHIQIFYGLKFWNCMLFNFTARSSPMTYDLRVFFFLVIGYCKQKMISIVMNNAIKF
jgi:hypothetical protein